MMPQTYPVFAAGHITPFVSSLLTCANTIAVIPNTNQPKKKLTMPQIFAHVASCDSVSSTIIGAVVGDEANVFPCCVLQPQFKQITASSAISFPQCVQNFILHTTKQAQQPQTPPAQTDNAAYKARLCLLAHNATGLFLTLVCKYNCRDA